MSASPFHSFPETVFLLDDLPEFYPSVQLAPPSDQDDNHTTFTVLEPPTLIHGDPSMFSGNHTFDMHTDEFCDTEDDPMSWSGKMPEQWTINEVLDWICHFAERNQVMDIMGEAFNRHNGERLCQLSRQAFMRLEPTHGGQLYDALQQLRQQLRFFPATVDSKAQCAMSKGFEAQSESFAPNDMTFDMELAEEFSSRCKTVNIDGGIYQYDYDLCSDIGRYSGQNVTADCHPECIMPMTTTTTFIANTKEEDVDDETCPRSAAKRTTAKGVTRNKSVGRTLDKKTDNTGHSACTRGRKRGQTSKGNHLWEFVVEMLSRSDTSSVLCWESKSQGIFRFLQSAEVARLWGRRKNNHKMTYEKLSRAMRFCRKAGYFESVPRTGQYPKKLVFKFGPKAENWQRAVK